MAATKKSAAKKSSSSSTAKKSSSSSTAKKSSSSSTAKKSSSSSSSKGQSSDNDAPKMRAGRVAREAMKQLSELISYSAEGVTSVRRDDDEWVVEVEVVEVRRIPETTDVMATYEVTLDESGDMLEYRRIRRYGRGELSEGRSR